ncbi:glycosyl transferase, family 14 protein, partial [Tanacetum coccineum]
YPNNIPLKTKDKFHDLPLFASVTNGIAKPTIDTSLTNANIRALVLNDQDLINVEDPSMVLLVKLKDVNSMRNMYVICRNKGFTKLKIHHVGGQIWIQFPSSSSANYFQTNAFLKSVYSCIKIATPSFKVDERMIWIEIRGLPLCAWGSNSYKKVADMFGKFMFFEAEESTKMSSGRICISTKSHNFVSERVLVEVHGVNYDVHVQELGTWNINIVDETLDSFDNLDVNGMKKVEDSVDENSLADLNDLNDLKETINELASNEIQHPISKENMDQEDDINKVSPEIVVSSNLSRPPGFKHMKRTSSKCSTSFARYRNKDIKEVSLIEELLRVKIGTTNVRLEPTLPQKEETFQVNIDVIMNSTCLKAFTISAKVSEIFMQQFWHTIKKVKGTNSYEFDLANKKCIVDVEVFRKILNICPRVQGEDFTKVLDDESTLTFLIDLGYKGLLHKHPSMYEDHMHQPCMDNYGCYYQQVSFWENVDYPELIWEDFAFQIDHRMEKQRRRDNMSSSRVIKKKVSISAKENIIPEPAVVLELGKSMSLTEAAEEESARLVHATHERIVTESDPEPARRRPSGIAFRDTSSVSKKMSPDPSQKLKGVQTLTPKEKLAADIMQALKASRKSSRSQPHAGGSSEGTGTKPGVPDEEKGTSAAKADVILDWGSEEESEYSKEENVKEEDDWIYSDDDEEKKDDVDDDKSIDLEETNNEETDDGYVQKDEYVSPGRFTGIEVFTDCYKGAKNADPENFTIYIHSKPGILFDESVTKSAFFYNRQLRNSVEVGWGTPTMIEAEKLLFKAALDDPANQIFVLLSDSFIDATDDPREKRYNPEMSPDIPEDKWRKGSQWITLVRRHAEVVAYDHAVFPIFEKHCKIEQQQHNCIPDEHYVPTLLVMWGFEDELERRTLTYSLWNQSTETMDTQAWHPVTFGYAGASQKNIQNIKAGTSD